LLTARRLHRFAARSARQVVACLLMVSLAGGIAGIPVIELGAKDRSRPFPCQDNPCGCSSAAECWHHCCCHTNRQKVAWAEAHGVIPPSYVVDAAEKEVEPTQEVCEHHTGCPACAKRAAAQTSHPSACASHCCDSHATDASAGNESKSHLKNQPKSGLRATLVLSDLARQCRGLPRLWTLLSQVLPAPVRAAWSLDLSVVGDIGEVSLHSPRVALSPLVRPPEQSASRCG
jgi:hypothetical protein